MAQRNSNQQEQRREGNSGKYSLRIIISAAVLLFFELCLFNIFGQFGGWIRYGLMGFFGLASYVLPVGIFILILVLTYAKSNQNRKIICGILFFIFLAVFLHLVNYEGFEEASLIDYFKDCAEQAKGGGIIGGAIALGLTKALSLVGAYIVTILILIICLLLICEVPFLNFFHDISERKRLEMEEEEAEERAIRSSRREIEPDEEPDKIVRPRRRAEEHYNEEPGRAMRSSRRQKAPVYYDEDPRDFDEYYEEPPRRRKSRNEDELVYETTNEDGVVIRIVHSKKKHTRDKAELKRASNRAESLRDRTGRPSRTLEKKRGIGENIDLNPLPENVDEIREITAPAPKQESFAVEEEKTGQLEWNQTKLEQLNGPELFGEGRSAERSENLESRFENERQKAENPGERTAGHTKVDETASASGQKVPRRNKKPSSKITSQTELHEEKQAKASSNKQLPDDIAVKAVAPVKQTAGSGYVYPPMSLLAQRKGKGKASNDEELDKVARKLEVILSNFGVAAKVIDRQAGPSVTRYELQPEMGTRVSKITALEDDLKLNLAVSDIRIEAPIPGRAAVGIEIPNAEKETVLMRELLEAPDLINHKSRIAFAAGVDISGDVIVADIAKMPHLLVAGTTGSGKSTFINTIIMAILYRARPDEVGLIIIDPKKIEFGVYSGIPHLVKDVVTDPGQAVGTLRWAVNEMTNRYQRMQLSGVRDFKNYNEKFDKGTLNPEEENPKKMPQIVIVIDELADLMMVASKEAEALICRLAQLARAAGIHLIIATQRPSVDVVTGLIKANIPARVALLVASQVDSRTIIDMKGAEELLGYGDMLFYPTGYSKPVRVQGAFVSDDEVANVVGFLKKNKTTDYFAEEAQQMSEYMNSAGEGAGESSESSGRNNNSQDEYLFEAGKLCIEMGKASSSMLQRHFSVGFNRAAKIIDQLTEMGAISPPNGAKPREILVDLYTFEEMFQSKSE